MHRSVYRTLSASAGLYVVFFLGAPPPGASQDVPGLRERIVGVWRLNRDQSDNPQGRLAPAEGREGGRPAGRGGRPGGGVGDQVGEAADPAGVATSRTGRIASRWVGCRQRCRIYCRRPTE